MQEGQQGRTRFQVAQGEEGNIQRRGGPTRQGILQGFKRESLRHLRVVKDSGTKEGCSKVGDMQTCRGI